MFNKMDLARIWDSINNINSGIIKDGKKVNCQLEVVDIPAMEEIGEKAISDLKKRGFSIKRVSPREANCVIRAFRHEGFIYEEEMYWIFGADTFLKTIGGMRSSYDTIIEYSEYTIEWWVYQDETTRVKPHFVDYFVKIS